MIIDLEDWKKKLGCYIIVNCITYKWLGGNKWRKATKEEQTIKLIKGKP